jgi:serine protease Do
VGVNYAGETTYDYNFAIHRDEVQDVIEQLIAGESVMSLGINGMGVSGEDGGLGVWVASVAAGSAADEAGIEPGDLITRMQGVSVGTDGTMREYCDVLRTHGTEAALDMEIYRPAEGAYYRGQVNGDALTAVPVIGGGGSGGGGGAQASGEFIDVVDANGNLTVQVPVEWSDHLLTPLTDEHGNVWSQIVASSNVAAHESGWSVAGVSLRASATATRTTSPMNLLDATRTAVTPDGCISAGVNPFADGYHTGEFEYYTDCGSTKSDYIVIAALADDGSYLIYVAIQAIGESDLAAVDRVVSSFIAGF